MLRSSRHRLVVPTAAAVLLLLAPFVDGCAEGGKGTLAPIDPATVRVNETLRIRLRVVGSSDERYTFRYAAPDELVGLASTVNLTSFGNEGLFTWTPLPSHVGSWSFVFKLIDSGRNVIDERTVTITVEPAADTAPVFVSPGTGGTFDLSSDPCVRFVAEVRDEDSPMVTIRARRPLPRGATLEPDGAKRASFQWCPSPEQTSTSERWTIALEADDGSNPPVPHDYVVVLRVPTKPGCPGEPPMVTIETPEDGARVEAPHGWPVTIRVTDDTGVRDAPILYYTTERPSGGTPDLSRMETAFFVAEGDGRFSTRIPPRGEIGQETSFWFLASVTDNDDTGGTDCDHRTDTPLRSFVGVRTMGASTTELCASCEASGECIEGHCVAVEGGKRCLPDCAETACTAGACADAVSAEGAVVRACTDLAAVCGVGTGGRCEPDPREEDDDTSTATSWPDGVMELTDGTICEGDDDYFAFLLFEDDKLEVTISFRHAEGDLDMELLDDAGNVVDRSAGVSDTETVSTCVGPGADGGYYARVFGYDGDENRYRIRAVVTPEAPDCCTDDANEDDDTREQARDLAPDDVVAGKICPGDKDWFRFDVSAPSRASLLLTFRHAAGDLDLRLYAPDGSLVDSSLSVDDDELIEATLETPGIYYVQVSGWRDARNDYELLLDLTPAS